MTMWLTTWVALTRRDLTMPVGKANMTPSIGVEAHENALQLQGVSTEAG